VAVVQKGLLFRGWSLKIAISIAKLGIVLGVFLCKLWENNDARNETQNEEKIKIN